ncbi:MULTISPECIES: hypothetical protein [unclassified Streptomyces]|uniref:hypothetical protein n=1 Tax=Streptomyces TaxID=1883 RepID=UPI0037AF4FB8
MALIQVAARMRELKRVRSERDAARARADFHKREALRTTRDEARAWISGPVPTATGGVVYLVSVDGGGLLGTVQRPFRGGRTWTYTRTDGSSGQEYSTRKAAAGALVWRADLDCEAAERRSRQKLARTVVPDGWERADWDDLTAFDLIRTPVYGRAEDGGLYPRAWQEPCEVRGVTRLDSGGLVISLAQADRGTDPLFVSSQEMKEVGVLWPAGRTRPEPQPWRETLRIHIADIADDIETIRRPFGTTSDLQELADLLARLERAHSESLFADLRRVVSATGYLRVQVGDSNQPHEVREIKSWAVAAHLKAKHALEVFATDPDFAWALRQTHEHRPGTAGDHMDERRSTCARSSASSSRSSS